MSFQHFRLGQLAMSSALPPHLMNAGPGTSTSTMQVMQGTAQNHPQSATQYLQNNSSASTPNSSTTPSKAPYGSGDQEDGYTLVFANYAAFEEWKKREEETQMVDFVKGDTHGSKADPPRFKSHTKLVCARHSRSGRKKYVKKHPERVRKVPSRKIEGVGCPASISFKTYFDTEEVRACYHSEHSHPIGEANLMFTKRGRKAMAEKHGSKPAFNSVPVSQTSSSPTNSQVDQQQQVSPPLPGPFPPQTVAAPAPPAFQPPQPQPQPGFAPNGGQYQLHQIPIQDRWDNMTALYTSIRETARSVMYDPGAVAALETLLLRMYLDSPTPHAINMGGHPVGMPPPMNHMPPPHQHMQHQQQQQQQQHQMQMGHQVQNQGNHETGETSSDGDGSEEE
jgi:hypothetical protein